MENTALMQELFGTGRLKGYIQTFWGNGGELPACQASLQKGEESIMFKAAR